VNHGSEGSNPGPESPSERPAIGIVGAGAVGSALGVALSRAGWPVVAVAGRDHARLARFVDLIPGVRLCQDAASLAQEVDLVILAVPDDAVAAVAATMRLRPGHGLVHTSGLLGAAAMSSVRSDDGAPMLGSFHPMVSFTGDVERSVADLRGATIALEGDERLMETLRALVVAVGARPMTLASGAKPLYHAAAVLASGGLVALLDAAVRLGAAAGLSEPDALAVYSRLTEQTLANARTAGVAAALTGPVARGDAGTVKAHLSALRENAPELVDLYLAAARQNLRIAVERGTLAPIEASRVRQVIAKDA
jgi:predicted short-subunit dehydrogenase-like oxidoreductase (DUF2520 family)